MIIHDDFVLYDTLGQIILISGIIVILIIIVIGLQKLFSWLIPKIINEINWFFIGRKK